MEQLMIMIKKIDGHISNRDYLTCKKNGMNLTWKIWVIIMIIIWKFMFYLLGDVFEKFIDTFKILWAWSMSLS